MDIFSGIVYLYLARVPSCTFLFFDFVTVGAATGLAAAALESLG